MNSGFFAGRSRVGVWLSRVGLVGAEEAQAAAREIERLGYGTLWIGESTANKEILSNAAILLAGTSTLAVATGIANLYARDPYAARAGAETLGEAYPGRFLLGIGVSHAPSVAQRGHEYRGPVTVMREYLDGMAAADYRGPAAEPRVPVLLAALRPKMLGLARDRTDGAHPYFVPVEHTRRAREVLGDGPLLAPELMIVLDEDPTTARATARRAMTPYLALPNYANNLLELGYERSELDDGGSDRLVDDLIAWGSPADIHARIAQHLEAGADHVCIQPLNADLDACLDDLRELAPVVSTPSIPR
jgi:probable F420-dependent oxidoreductase